MLQKSNAVQVLILMLLAIIAASVITGVVLQWKQEHSSELHKSEVFSMEAPPVASQPAQALLTKKPLFTVTEISSMSVMSDPEDVPGTGIRAVIVAGGGQLGDMYDLYAFFPPSMKIEKGETVKVAFVQTLRYETVTDDQGPFQANVKGGLFFITSKQ